MKLIDADALIEVIKKNHYPLRDAFNSLDVGMFTNGIIQAINELAENGCCGCEDAYYEEESNEMYCRHKGAWIHIDDEIMWDKSKPKWCPKKNNEN